MSSLDAVPRPLESSVNGENGTVIGRHSLFEDIAHADDDDAHADACGRDDDEGLCAPRVIVHQVQQERWRTHALGAR